MQCKKSFCPYLSDIIQYFLDFHIFIIPIRSKILIIYTTKEGSLSFRTKDFKNDHTGVV